MAIAVKKVISTVVIPTVLSIPNVACASSKAGDPDAVSIQAETSSIKDEARKRAITETPAPAADQKAVPPGELPLLLREIETKYAKADTLKAQFNQVDTIEAFGTTKSSSGEIWLKRPDKLRWETQQPDRNTLVSDGETFWFYTPPFDEDERGQVLIRKADSVKTKLASALLAGSFSMAKDMKISEEAPSRFTLVPKKGSAGTVQKATIEVDADKKIIEKVVLEHRGGNRSEITLSKVEFSPKMADDMFMFVAPPYTDVVGSESPGE